MFYSGAIVLLLAYSALGQDLVGCPEIHGLQVYPHPQLCDHFYKCANGTLTLEQCENGLLFDGKGAVHNSCNYYWAVHCDERKAEVVPLSTPGCEFQFGIYPTGPHCDTNYIKCAHGIPTQHPCEPGLAYDPKTHSCNWPDLLADVCNPEAVVGFKCPDAIPAHSLARKFLPYPRYVIPGNCHQIVTCVNHFPRLISCEHGKVVNENSLTCEDPEEFHGACALKK